MEFKVNHDLHCHTSLSLCCGREEMNPENILEHIKDFGYDTICFTNHYWDEKAYSSVPVNDFYRPQNTEHLKKLLPLPQKEGIRVLFGCETDINMNFEIGISPEHYDLFDFIIMPPNHMHNKGFIRSETCSDIKDITELYLQKLERITKSDLPFEKLGIAHMTARNTFLRNPQQRHEIFDAMDTARLKDIFSFFAEHGTGIELNSGCFHSEADEHMDSYLRIYAIAKECGCKFYCGSDSHSIDNLPLMRKLCSKVANALGLTDKDRYIVPYKN